MLLSPLQSIPRADQVTLISEGSLCLKSLENFPSHEAEAEAQIQVAALNMEPTFKRGAKDNFWVKYFSV